MKKRKQMFFWNRKKSLNETGIFKGFRDYHSHILYGVDDGVKTLEEALDILSLYESLGFSEVWLTPHIMEDIPNETARLKSRFEELKNAYREKLRGDLELHLAAEYMLDPLFEERLRTGDLLPIGKEGNHLLVETSYYNAPGDLYHLLEMVKSKGYYPLLAHPERYRYMEEKDYERLRKMGVKFQLNLPALAGMYSSHTEQKAYRLLEKGYYDVAGNDIHSFRSFLQVTERKTIQSKRLKHLQPKEL